MSLGRDDSNSSSLNGKRVTSALGGRDSSRTLQTRNTLRTHKFNPTTPGDSSHNSKHAPIKRGVMHVNLSLSKEQIVKRTALPAFSRTNSASAQGNACSYDASETTAKLTPKIEGRLPDSGFQRSIGRQPNSGEPQFNKMFERVQKYNQSPQRKQQRAQRLGS